MMKSLNSVSITGNLGQDPEIRHFESGSCVAQFTIAVGDRVKGENVTHWISCEAWNKLASDVIAKYCHKGSKVGITGKLKVQSWQDRATGDKRSKVFVSVLDIALLDSKQDSGKTVHQPHNSKQ